MRRYAAQQLAWVTSHLDPNATDEHKAQLRQKMSKCRTEGLRDASVSLTDDLEAFAGTIESVQEATDVDLIVESILMDEQLLENMDIDMDIDG